ncbi:MAG: putative peptidoglycan glycosyltransferase FtsW [Alphaproteobacteria bacterium]|nr:putative peptidoglycan glycosyltransferase FtsW [Alphaproteobacteria bacterium]
MSSVARTDTSLMGNWWWTVDRWSFGSLVLLVLFGALMVFAASPAVALRLDLGSYHFVQRQLMLLPVALVFLVVLSLPSPSNIRRLACLGFVGCVVLMILTLIFGAEIKGARRWLSVAGFSLQASEFLKPCFAVVAAWMFAEWRRTPEFPGHWIAMGLYVLVVGLLLLQPDLGQAVIVSAVWFGQFFLAGLPIVLVISLFGLGVVGLVGAYFIFPHVSDRVDRFLNPASSDTYQVDRSLEAFANGGLVGTGPGEGKIKGVLPDAHADFVFAVAGEEFGALVCLALIAVFSFLVLRGFLRLISETDLFILIAAAGLLAQLGLQSFVHMASSLQLIPAKGMTLPFISYGGSSLLALSIGMGMMLGLTRRRPGRGRLV